jgi:hypothetical protein
MLSLMGVAQSLAETDLHAWIVAQAWLWPALEIGHFVGLTLLIGGLLVVDLSILGGADQTSLRRFYRLLPLVLVGFALNLATGILFCYGDPFRYAANMGFQLKILVMLAAGINASYHHWRLTPLLLNSCGVSRVGYSAAAKVSAALSLACWFSVLLLGRLIPYVGTG